ncbi:hypothetical protein V1512DRAFT_257735 [Lipomyces arxii]|uniref:uncharacterized protein n=1 Tax=Lipomyces arxii TaxID=56418 RepID=UPI0034CF2279
MSTGARAGVAIGVIAGALLIFAIVFFVIRAVKRRRAQVISEKGTPSSFSGPAPLTTPPAAHTSSEKPPRLSIRVSRPVSGLLPLSLLSGRSATRTSTGALQATTVDRNSTGSVESLSSNGSSSPGSSYASSLSSSSSDTNVLVIPAPRDPFAGPLATAAASTDASADAASASTNNVHRAIMDFAPTMHDELGLKDGMLVRVLHEYDDGWALCVKLDRSAQGVCPRSCLSARALRPRPKRGARVEEKAEPRAGRNITRAPTDPATPTIQVFAPDSESPFEVRP